MSVEMAGVRMLIAAREGAGLMEIEMMKRREIEKERERGRGERSSLDERKTPNADTN